MIPELNIHINSIEGTQMAAKINGVFELDSYFFHFFAIAFGRIGGQNIGAKLEDRVKEKIKNLGYDTEEIINEIQQNLVQGNLDLPQGLKKETFADD